MRLRKAGQSVCSFAGKGGKKRVEKVKNLIIKVCCKVFCRKGQKKVKDLRAKGWIIREPDREEALSSKPSQKKSKT